MGCLLKLYASPNQVPYVLDLTFASANLVPHLRWEIMDDSIGSDHCALSYTLNLCCDAKVIYPARHWKESRCDWNIFFDSLKFDQTHFNSFRNNTERYTYLIDVIVSACNNATPTTQPFIPK